MSTYRIYQVHMAPSDDGTHEHIERVRIGLGTDSDGLWVSTVVADIRTPGGDRYYTEGGGYRADVHAIKCPRCSFRDYITTHPDSTTTNNLLHLPRY